MQVDLTKTIGNWIKHNKTPIFVTTIFISYGFVLYLQPHYTWFELQRSMMAIGQVIVGFIEFPLRLFSLFASRVLTEHMGVVAFVYFIFAGLGVGKVMQFLWKSGLAGRIGVVIAVLANNAIGLFMLASSDISVVAKPSQTCENFISPQNGLRILEFDEVGILPGVHFFYLFSSNGGKTWEQLMVTRYDDLTDPDCSTVSSLDDELIWIWSSYGVRITKDNGKTWKKWDWECCSYGAVKKVEFQNFTSGTIHVNQWNNDISRIITSDGGNTWEPVK